MNTVFTTKLEKMQPELFRFACKLTGNREDASDLLQETFLKALKNEDKYTPAHHYEKYFYQ
jgi:RNA polymerase sigma-70 factor (ECF subfamily)